MLSLSLAIISFQLEPLAFGESNTNILKYWLLFFQTVLQEIKFCIGCSQYICCLLKGRFLTKSVVLPVSSQNWLHPPCPFGFFLISSVLIEYFQCFVFIWRQLDKWVMDNRKLLHNCLLFDCIDFKWLIKWIFQANYLIVFMIFANLPISAFNASVCDCTPIIFYLIEDSFPSFTFLVAFVG